jgi:RimJ/RimL family protein N-acetyltransferase
MQPQAEKYQGPIGYVPGAAWQLVRADAAKAGLQYQEARDNCFEAADSVVPVSTVVPQPTIVPARDGKVSVVSLDPAAIETLALVRLVVTHPEVWPSFSHDFMGSPEDFVPPWLGQREVLAARKRKNVIGVFMLANFQEGIWIAHWAFFPWAQGRDVKEAAITAARMMFARDDCWMLVGLTPAANKAALYSSRRVGFRRVGVLQDATRIGGKWTDLVISQMTAADLG